jgi:hypothetical protein
MYYILQMIEQFESESGRSALMIPIEIWNQFSPEQASLRGNTLKDVMTLAADGKIDGIQASDIIAGMGLDVLDVLADAVYKAKSGLAIICQICDLLRHIRHST